MPKPFHTFDRRMFLRGVAAVSATAATPRWLTAQTSIEQGMPLPPRADGELDIHHIDTGRGSSTLLVFPDGTTVLIDAGASAAPLTTSAPPRPDTSRRPGEWIARYIQRQTHAEKLDYFVATHVHPDHIGDVSDTTPAAPAGGYRLTGISDVDALLPINCVIDRSFPDYAATGVPLLKAPFAENYVAYLQYRQSSGRKIEKAQVGSSTQITARDGRNAVQVRILAANGHVWTGKGSASRALFPDTANFPPEDRPAENICSVALRLSYGRFSYFAGGDLASDTHDGRLPWMDIETPVARAAGRTEVASADHHGYFDACGPEFVRALDAQAYVIPSWDVGHPAAAQAQRMLGAWAGKASRDVYATETLPANRLINSRFTPLFRAQQGHIVVRVARGGDSYRIFAVDSTVEDGLITFASKPYLCRA